MKRGKKTKVAPTSAADSPHALQERILRQLQAQSERLDAQMATAKVYSKAHASQAANLARATAALTAEMRKSDEDCLAQVDKMSLIERLGVMKQWLKTCPAAIRADLAAWLADNPMETKR